MSERRKRIEVVNQRGLHARASAKFVNAVAELPNGCSVRVAKGDNEAAGGSILGLMMLGAAKGDTIELIVAASHASYGSKTFKRRLKHWQTQQLEKSVEIVNSLIVAVLPQLQKNNAKVSYLFRISDMPEENYAEYRAGKVRIY